MKKTLMLVIAVSGLILGAIGCAPKPEGDLAATPEPTKSSTPAEKPADDKAAATTGDVGTSTGTSGTDVATGKGTDLSGEKPADDKGVPVPTKTEGK